METCLRDLVFASIDFIISAPVVSYYDSQHLPTTAAATIEAAAARSRAGEATIGSGRTKTDATGAIRATYAPYAVAEACIPRKVA